MRCDNGIQILLGERIIDPSTRRCAGVRPRRNIIRVGKVAAGRLSEFEDLLAVIDQLFGAMRDVERDQGAAKADRRAGTSDSGTATADCPLKRADELRNSGNCSDEC